MTLGAARVIYQISDLSAYIDQLMQGYVIVVVETERGPVWTPTPVQSWDEFERLFGRCYSGSDDPLVLKTGLLQGAKFLVIRIVNCTDPGDISTMTAAPSTLTLQDRGDVPTAGSVTGDPGPFNIVAAHGGEVTGSEMENFVIVTSTNDAMKIKVGAGSSQPFVLAPGTDLTASDIAADINGKTTDLNATATADGKVKIAAIDAADAIEIESCTTDAYSTLGFLEGVYAVEAGTDFLVISMDGGTDQEFTLTAGSARTAAQVVADLSGLTGGSASVVNGAVKLTSGTTGGSSSVQVQSTSTADDDLGFDNDLHEGLAASSEDTLTFEAANPGAWGNSLRIHVYDSDLNPGDHFDIRVSYSLQGGLNEYFGNLSMDPTSERYAVNYINERSRLVVVTDENSINPNPSSRPVVDENGTAMTGGDNGDPVDEADYIGDEMAQTGIYAADKTDMSIDLMIPGTTSVTVMQAATAYCEDRGELICYFGFAPGLDPDDAKAFRMGDSPYSHEAFNSHRCVLVYGRPLVYNSQTDSRKYVSPLGMLAACIARTDTYYNYSYAPVGPRRGTVDFVEGIDFDLAKYPGYQDMLADYQINSLIINRQQGIEGAMFWEQYTTQRAASALRDLNVVRFLTAMRKLLMPVLRTFLFEPNHPITWREVHRTLEPAFQQWMAENCIYAYYLQTDRDAWFNGAGELKNAILNDGQNIDQGIYRCRVLIQPTRAIRYLEFTVGVLRTGEAFIHYSELKELPGWYRS